MVLEPTPLCEHPEIWEMLRDSGVDVFSKANGEGCKIGLISILKELRPDGSRPEEPRRRYFPETTVPFPKHSLSPAVVKEAPLLPGQREDLQAILTRLHRGTRATTVTLLHLKPGQSRLLMEACMGKPFPLEQANEALRQSPDNYADMLRSSDYEILTYHDLQPRTVRLAGRITPIGTKIWGNR